MADDRQARGTSYSKHLDGLAYKENALDRARSLKEQFERAQNRQDKQQSLQTEKSSAQQGSQMVKEDAPGLKPTPGRPMRDAPDRQASQEKLAKEHDREAAKLERARKAHEALKARQGKPRDHDLDRER